MASFRVQVFKYVLSESTGPFLGTVIGEEASVYLAAPKLIVETVLGRLMMIQERDRRSGPDTADTGWA